MSERRGDQLSLALVPIPDIGHQILAHAAMGAREVRLEGPPWPSPPRRGIAEMSASPSPTVIANTIPGGAIRPYTQGIVVTDHRHLLPLC